jgi:uncharacterized protein (TIGR02996 family)
MSTHDSLLQAVIANPDDDTPRNAYADWLDKEGDRPRAEFIRVQCALAAMLTDHAQRVELQQREAELLGQYGYHWAEPLGEQISVWVYQRGFIERVEMGLEVPADHIRDVLTQAPIRHIRDTTQLVDLNGVVEALPHLKHLTGLEFWSLYAVDDALVARMLAAPELAGLRTLILHHDRNGNLIKEPVLVAALASPLRANLQELAMNVDGTWQGPSARIVQAMARSPYLANVRKLDLSNARLGAQTVRALGRSTSLADLTELDLGGCSLTADTWREVLALPQLPRLRWLRLSRARVVTRQRTHEGYLRELPAFADAFEQASPQVDWDTDTISPFHGTTWTGFSWAARRQNLLFGMQRFVEAGDYDALEKEYRGWSLLHSGQSVTAEVSALPFDDYQQHLGEALDAALAQPEVHNAGALFLRIDLIDGWDGEFHTQSEPPALRAPFAEYSYPEPLLVFSAPAFPEAARLFANHPYTGLIHPSGPALYLIARTVAAFGRCLRSRSVGVPVWFSCVWAAFAMGSAQLPVSQ